MINSLALLGYVSLLTGAATVVYSHAESVPGPALSEVEGANGGLRR